MVEYDVLVVGSGILGLSTAYHIKSQNPNLNVLVIDRFPSAGLGSTANSAAAFRTLFSSPANFALADSSADFYKHLQQQLHWDLQMRFCGYLWCFTQPNYQKVLSSLNTLRAQGLEFNEYAPSDLRSLIGIETDFSGDTEAKQRGLGDLHRALFVPKAGVIGVPALVRFYQTEFLRLGGEIRFGVEVNDLLVQPQASAGLVGEPYFWQEAAVTGAKTTEGLIRAKKTVVAAGPWCARLLDAVGVECHVKPRKRQVFSVMAKTEPLKKLLFVADFSNAGCSPFIVLPKPSVYLRHDVAAQRFSIGFADEFPRPFKLEDHPRPEPDFYTNGLYPVVSKFLPQFVGADVASSFAGLYEVNTLDEQPVIFEENGLFVVGGASGSGIMKADAIGRVAAALYAGKEFAPLFGGREFRVSDLSLKRRHVEPENLII